MYLGIVSYSVIIEFKFFVIAACIFNLHENTIAFPTITKPANLLIVRIE